MRQRGHTVHDMSKDAVLDLDNTLSCSGGRISSFCGNAKRVNSFTSRRLWE